MITLTLATLHKHARIEIFCIVMTCLLTLSFFSFIIFFLFFFTNYNWRTKRAIKAKLCFPNFMIRTAFRIRQFHHKVEQPLQRGDNSNGSPQFGAKNKLHYKSCDYNYYTSISFNTLKTWTAIYIFIRYE